MTPAADTDATPGAREVNVIADPVTAVPPGSRTTTAGVVVASTSRINKRFPVPKATVYGTVMVNVTGIVSGEFDAPTEVTRMFAVCVPAGSAPTLAFIVIVAGGVKDENDPPSQPVEALVYWIVPPNVPSGCVPPFVIEIVCDGGLFPPTVPENVR